MDRLFNRQTLIILLVVVFGAACFHMHESRTTLEKSWPSAGVDQLRVRGVNGRIEVSPSTGTEITMRADISVSGRSEESIDKDETVRAELSGSILDVVERGRSGRGFLVFGRGGQRVDFAFKVPPSTSLDLETVNGRVHVENINGRLELQSVNGRIEAKTGHAEMVAKTVNGRIIATFTDEFRGARMKTVNGSIEISVPAGSRIACDVHQVNGSFQSELPVRMGESQNGEHMLEVNTVNGSVTLRESGTAAAELNTIDARADDILSDLPAVPELPEPPSPPAPPAAK
jgi:hypothetical protein